MGAGLILASMAHGALVIAAYVAPSPTLWYLTRAVAFSAYIAMTIAVILGMLRSIARGAGERISWMIDELHQFITLLSFLLVGAHLVTLYFDPFLPFSLLNFVLPFNEPYLPLSTNLGVYALYALVLIQCTSWLRSRIPYRSWRAIHYVSFVCFALVTAHGWLTGSDTVEPWMRAIYVGSSAMVAFLILVRVFSGNSRIGATA